MIDQKIQAANERLSSANLRVRIQHRYERLYLVATLPPKPGDRRQRPFQQRIALGVAANPAGLALAEREAKKIAALLDCKEFEWTPYLSPSLQPANTIGEWLEKFEKAVRPTVSEITWQTDYRDAFRKLDVAKVLTYELLESAVLTTLADSRQRKRVCQAFTRLAKFAGLEGDFSHLKGNYSARTVDPRSLPSDEEIAEFYKQISNPGWKWVYGMIATYGLRPHEAFFLDTSDLVAGGETITVLQGKTNKERPRQVWPYYPEWINAFNLRSPVLPDVTGNQNSDYGDRVTCYLRARCKMPFRPYDLRHCWARRAILFGLHDALASKQMGHSLTVHSETYHLWIDGRSHQIAHERAINRDDRPIAPLI